jgi:hypothetical protein
MTLATLGTAKKLRVIIIIYIFSKLIPKRSTLLSSPSLLVLVLNEKLKSTSEFKIVFDEALSIFMLNNRKRS